jgi:hypothetical protein
MPRPAVFSVRTLTLLLPLSHSIQTEHPLRMRVLSERPESVLPYSSPRAHPREEQRSVRRAESGESGFRVNMPDALSSTSHESPVYAESFARGSRLTAISYPFLLHLILTTKDLGLLPSELYPFLFFLLRAPSNRGAHSANTSTL